LRDLHGIGEPLNGTNWRVYCIRDIGCTFIGRRGLGVMVQVFYLHPKIPTTSTETLCSVQNNKTSDLHALLPSHYAAVLYTIHCSACVRRPCSANQNLYSVFVEISLSCVSAFAGYVNRSNSDLPTLRTTSSNTRKQLQLQKNISLRIRNQPILEPPIHHKTP
jgi:hypothetical protein